jgi:hypothetical protein
MSSRSDVAMDDHLAHCVTQSVRCMSASLALFQNLQGLGGVLWPKVSGRFYVIGRNKRFPDNPLQSGVGPRPENASIFCVAWLHQQPLIAPNEHANSISKGEVSPAAFGGAGALTALADGAFPSRVLNANVVAHLRLPIQRVLPVCDP